MSIKSLPPQQIVLQEYVHAVKEQLDRTQRLTQQIQELVPQWYLAPLVKALQALRGVSLIVAATTVAEIGDLARARPRIPGPGRTVADHPPQIPPGHAHSGSHDALAGPSRGRGDK